MVAANGARFHVAVAGSGPLVVLLHGFPQFWWTWRHQLGALAEAGFRAVAMDLRGYGGSDKPPRGYDPLTLAADVAGVVRSLGDRDAVLVGHGWGGLVAWTAAASQRQHVRAVAVLSCRRPRALRAAYLTDRTSWHSAGLVAGFQVPMAPERRLVARDAAVVGSLLRRWSRPGWPDPEAELRYRRAAQVPGVAFAAAEGFRWVARSVRRSDGLRWARTVRPAVAVPSLTLFGAQDTAVPRPPAGKAVTVAGAGHFPHEEAPEAVSGALRDWLAGLDGRTGGQR
jgi:pimeloyl-ACP methyl ester carboxylesterase